MDASNKTEDVIINPELLDGCPGVGDTISKAKVVDGRITEGDWYVVTSITSQTRWSSSDGRRAARRMLVCRPATEAEIADARAAKIAKAAERKVMQDALADQAD